MVQAIGLDCHSSVSYNGERLTLDLSFANVRLFSHKLQSVC